jgi:ketosteroid isomerase-like protein
VSQVESLEGLVSEFAEAWARSDVESLDALLADPYHHTDINGRVWDRSNWLADAAQPKPVEAISCENVDVWLRGDLAVVTGRNVATFRSDERGSDPFQSALRFTQVWVHEGNSWKRAYFQATAETVG